MKDFLQLLPLTFSGRTGSFGCRGLARTSYESVRHNPSDGGRFASVVCFVSVTRGRSSMVEERGGECGEEVGTIQGNFPSSILYRYGKGGIKNGVHKSSSRSYDGGVI